VRHANLERDVMEALHPPKQQHREPLHEIGWWQRRQQRCCVRVIGINGKPLSRLQSWWHGVGTWIVLHVP